LKFWIFISKLDEEKSILLTKVEDWSGNTYSGIIIKNQIWQKKEFLSNTWVLINNDLKLYFEKNWVESILEINK